MWTNKYLQGKYNPVSDPCIFSQLISVLMILKINHICVKNAVQHIYYFFNLNSHLFANQKRQCYFVKYGQN